MSGSTTGKPSGLLRAGIYARKSTAQEDVGDEQRSITRQIEHTKAYAARKGWTVAAEHVYSDDGVSGAEFEKRPGLMRLLGDIRQKPRPFDALIVSERSRLGREMIETGIVRKQLSLAGIQVWSYLDDKALAFETASDRMVEAVMGIADDLERERARQRTHDALLQRARAGYVAGGLVFGYDNLRVDGHVERRVNEAEAAVVRRIFQLAADGYGYMRIAHTLNDEGVPCPKPRRGQRPGWAPSSVREVLYRELYRGVILWNRSRRRNTWGQLEARPRHEDEWIRVEAPQLRVIPEALWQAAHRRLAQTRQLYLGSTDGRTWGRPLSGLEGKYLLSRLAACGICGGAMYVRATPKTERAAYMCVAAVTRGRRACENGRPLPLKAADEAVLWALKRDLLRAEVIEEALTRTLDRARSGGGSIEARRVEMLGRLDKVEAELARLTEAVAQGGEVAALVRALREREEKRARIRAELERLDGLEQVARLDIHRAVGTLRTKLTDWQGLLQAHTPQGRQMLKTLLAERLIFTPHIEGEGVYWEFKGKRRLQPILEGTLEGYLNSWCPRGDSNTRHAV